MAKTEGFSTFQPQRVSPPTAGMQRHCFPLNGKCFSFTSSHTDMDIKVEFASFGLACAGWFSSILTRFLPMWSITGTVENVTTTLPLYWDGVWLNWQHQTTARLHCTFYQSLLFLTQHFTAWKILLITSIGVGFTAVAVYPIGWIRYPKNIRFKTASGPLFVVNGLLLLIVVSWITHLTDLNAEMLLTRTWGAAIFTGWMGTLLLVVGGGLLSVICCRAVQKQRQDGGTAQTAEPGIQDPLNTTQSTTFIQSPPTR